MDKGHPNVTHPKELIKKEFSGIFKFNYWIALKITNGVGTMWCAYAFFVLDLFMLPPVIKAASVNDLGNLYRSNRSTAGTFTNNYGWPERDPSSE